MAEPFGVKGSCMAAAAFMVLSLSCLLHLFIRRKNQPSWVGFPRGPPSWPILGHLPLFLSGLPHQILAALSQQHGYGPIIGLKLGSIPSISVCSAALAREILLTQDKAFANRPNYVLVDALFYGYDNSIIWSSYGPRWRAYRKICTLELFTTKRLQENQYVREEEMAGLLDRILKASCGGIEAIDIAQNVGDMTSNIISRLLQSKIPSVASYDAAGTDSVSKLVRDSEHEAVPTIGDFLPWLNLLDVLRKRNMRHIHARFDKLLDSMLLERREAMKRVPTDELPHDFLQVLLSKEAFHDTGPKQKDLEGLSTNEIKAMMMDILTAGVHSSTVTLEWAMAELLRNPKCLQKLREEIDAVLGDDGGQMVRDEDIGKLPYLENIVKEVLRLHPAAPLMPHMLMEACKVGNYSLPAGTQAFVNIWAIGRDPTVWQEPHAFWPDRFEGTDIDLSGQHFELLPFGSGRRICPGLRLGLALIQVGLANLVKAFDWELPHGQTPMSMDMSEKWGIVNTKATPVLAIPKPRRHS